MPLKLTLGQQFTKSFAEKRNVGIRKPFSIFI